MSDDGSSASVVHTPFFRATQAHRYERQQALRDIEDETGRAVVVFYGPMHHAVVAPFQDAIGDIPSDTPLDLMLTSPGGDAETALRLAMMCHAGRSDFRVIVPETAASAATLLALAAESILMSTTSALGPVDPQIFLPTRNSYYPAKDLVQIVDDLEQRTQSNPLAFEFYSALLGDIDGATYQAARASILRTEELVPDVLSIRSNPPSEELVEALTQGLQGPSMHSATIGYRHAQELGLPAVYEEPESEYWKMLWSLHVNYVVELGWQFKETMIEGRRASLRF